tara:strand:- start:187 stop:297 length:111 start_codon:yes stop_codon:yes gene_type:complete
MWLDGDDKIDELNKKIKVFYLIMFVLIRIQQGLNVL